MATNKYVEKSPYKQEKKKHPSDFQYSQFLEVWMPKNQKEIPSQFNVAIFGIGRAGTIHLMNVLANQRVKLLYVVDSDAGRLRDIQQRFYLEDDVITHIDQAQKVFEDQKIDWIIISTPTFTHEEIIVKALKNGKHVLSEKPLADHFEGIKKCYDLAKQNKLSILCAFNRRFDPSLCFMRDQIHKGQIGQMNVIKTTARDCPLPGIEYLKTSGGFIHDSGVHDIDLVCWMLGEYPTEVYTMAHSFIPELKEIDDYDTVLISLKFPCGVLGQIDLSRNAVYGYDQRLEVFGTQGMLSNTNSRPIQVATSTREGESVVPIHYSFPSKYHEAYKEEISHMCNALEGKDDIKVTGEEVLSIMKIVEAAEKSAKTGKPVAIHY